MQQTRTDNWKAKVRQEDPDRRVLALDRNSRGVNYLFSAQVTWGRRQSGPCGKNSVLSSADLLFIIGSIRCTPITCAFVLWWVKRAPGLALLCCKDRWRTGTEATDTRGYIYMYMYMHLRMYWVTWGSWTFPVVQDPITKAGQLICRSCHSQGQNITSFGTVL